MSTMGRPVIDITGQKNNMLTVIEKFFIDDNGVIKTRWKIKCDCGKIFIIRDTSLFRKNTSCGCYRKTREGTRMRHGLSRTKTHGAWLNMKERCMNPKNKSYKHYGGRGISFCERWKNFDLFLEDMGICPEGYSIDRINVNKDYSPDNCKWSSVEDQANNTRRNKRITYNGQTKTLAQWCRELNIPYARVLARLDKLGWSVDRAFGFSL